MTERTGKALLVTSSLLIPLFFVTGYCGSRWSDVMEAGGLAFFEIAASLFVFLAFPISLYLLWQAKKPAWVYFALSFNGLFFALEIMAAVIAFAAFRQGLID
jgi:hypothetical protein